MKRFFPHRFISLVLVCAVVLACFAVAVPAASTGVAVCPDFFWQNPLPQGNTLLQIAVVDGQTAWAVGDFGTIMKTTDGGATWQQQVSGTTKILRGICALDTNNAWVCGKNNVILKTSDGGNSWIAVTPEFYGDFSAVSAIDMNTAWVAGEQPVRDSIIEKTTDGGATWTDQSPVPLDMTINDISAVDANVVWAVTEKGNFYSSTDGGTNWNETGSPVAGGTHTRLKAFSATTVYAVADEGAFLKTNDGITFDSTYVGADVDLQGLAFANRQTGWVVGEKGFIGVTSDAGEHWATQSSGISSMLYGIGVAASGQMYASSIYGELLRAAGPIGPWIRLTSGDTDTLFDITSLGDRTAWTCGFDGTVLHTDDGGARWIQQPPGTGSDLLAIDALNSNVVWTVGKGGVIFKTSDGGTNWVAVDPGPGAGVELTAVSVISPDMVWVSGYDGLLMKTTDDGAHWQKLDVHQGVHDLKVNALDENRAYVIVAGTGYIRKTTDGGAQWVTQTCKAPGLDIWLNNICIVDDNVAYASAWVVDAGKLGDFGTVFKTTDGGAHWNSTINPYSRYTLLDVGSVDGVHVWTCGIGGICLKSNDGGKTWKEQNALQNTFLSNNVEAVDGQIAWLAGNGGYLVRTTAPTIYSIAPSNALATDDDRTVEISGNGFQNGMNVKLVKGNKEITCTRVQLLSPYRATFHVNLKDAEEGEYDVVATNTNRLTGRLIGGFQVTSGKTWFLAEGSTGMSDNGHFETWVLLQNPGNRQATAQLTYLTPQGEVTGPKVTLAAESRSTINVAETLPNTWEVSTKVKADQPIVAERAMYWDGLIAYRASATGSIGSPFASNTWYMAEGSTGIGSGGSFNTYITVANPGDADADVSVTFMTPEGPVGGPVSKLAAGARWTADASQYAPNQWSVATSVESNAPVVAERSVYWSGSEYYRLAAQNSIGASAISTEWFLAEGSTGVGPGGSFETWVVLQNPSNTTARARLDYRTPAGAVKGPEVELDPLSRQTINVADNVPNEFSVSTEVVSDNPIIAERSTYFNTPTAYRQAAQSSIGATAPSTEWLLAEGSTGGDANGSFETWVLVENPWSVAASVDLTYMTPEGQVAGPSVTVPGWGRVSINIADTVPNNWSVSTRVTSSRQVVAEAAVYWNAAGLAKQCAQDSIGFPIK